MAKSAKIGGKEIELERLKKVSMTLENLAFVLKSVKPEGLFDAAEVVGLLARSASIGRDQLAKSPGNPNKHYLIGILPRLLQDKVLFPQNEDIVDFASAALGLEMSRSEKRSRYEIIGKVVCETDTLGGAELSRVVRALERAAGDSDSFDELRRRKKSADFSWNETIQLLAEQR